MDFFYSGQTRRYLVQFMRIFSNIRVRNGPDSNGLYTIQRVPIMYGDPSSMVAQLIKGASENTVMPSPMFSAWIENVKMAPKRRQDTQHVNKISILERQFDVETQTYTNKAGARQDIERYMPVPYDFDFRLDVWTTNVITKLQIMEQICTIFNPSIQLQQNSNILDWTSIFEVWLEDVTWTNRSIPQGNEETRDVMSFKFKIEGWISPPAKLKRSSLIAEIVTNVFEELDQTSIDRTFSSEYDPFRTCIDGRPVQIITTVGGYKISVKHNSISNKDEITLLNEFGVEDPTLSWQELIKQYGQITANITKIRLKLDPDIDVDDADIIGNIFEDPNRKNVLFFELDLDTVPPTTIMPILDIVDPTELYPGHGLPAAAAGQRYLLVSQYSASEEPAIPPGVSTSPWGSNIVAYPNDIIEYNGIDWVVIFDSRNPAGGDSVINTVNNSQYTFADGQWSFTFYGTFLPGYWRIDNIISAPNGTTINNYE